MPYIHQSDRAKFEKALEPLFADIKEFGLTPGEMNFIITTIIKDWLDKGPKNYTSYNSMIGVLECAKQELYRRMIAPYEDMKKEDNGDVY